MEKDNLKILKIVPNLRSFENFSPNHKQLFGLFARSELLNLFGQYQLFGISGLFGLFAIRPVWTVHAVCQFLKILLFAFRIVRSEPGFEIVLKIQSCFVHDFSCILFSNRARSCTKSARFFSC